MNYKVEDKKLSELTDGTNITYGVVKPGDNPERGIRFIRGGDISERKINLSELRNITKEVSEEYSRTLLKGGELIISLVGNPGEVAIVPKKLKGANIARQVGLIRSNEDVIDKYYLMYYLTSPLGKAKLKANSRGSVQQVINLRELKNIEIPVYNLEVQKEIANQLKTIDQKIHLNRQTNETLEAMAKAIFKSWFVDFDPVRAKMEAKSAGRDPNRAAMAVITGISLDQGWDEVEFALDQKLSSMTEEQRQQLIRTAQLFPDELVESEIGEVPKGWETNRIDELGEIVTGKTPPTKNPENYGDDVPFLTIPDMHGNIYAIETSKYLSKKGADTQKNKYLPAGSVSMSCIASPGLVVLNHRECHTNQQINTLIPDEIEYSIFYFFLLIELSDEVIMKGSGGSVFKNMNKGQFSSLKVRMPEKKLRGFYNQQVKPLMDKILQNELESQSLSHLRDTLLPRLISGEIQI